MDASLHIRMAKPEDALALLAIYAPYVTDTAITFEYEVPSVEEFRSRIEATLQRFPYLVAEKDGKPVGYAYVSAFHPRAAYGWDVETSIYIQKDHRRCGAGGALYRTLENILREMHILNLNACIGYPAVPDEYLDSNSADFHRHFGYRLVGEFHQCGFKFGRWYNMIWMEKLLGEHPAEPQPVQYINDVRELISEKYGIR